MRKILLALVLFFLPIQSALAQTFPDPLGGADVPELVRRLIDAVLGLVGALFFVMFLWGGFRYMTAGGDASQVKGARTTLLNAVIGIVIIGLSYAIVTAVIGALVAGGTPAST